MLYAVVALDKPGALEIRKANRDAHIAYLKESPTVLAGPLLGDDGETMIGSLIVLDFESRAEADAWAEADPYAKAGLFESVSIRPWLRLIG